MRTTNSTSNGTVEGFLTLPHRIRIKVFEMMSPKERKALFAKLRQLRKLPREQWEEQEVSPLESPHEETYLVPFHEQLLVYFTPLADDTWRVDDITSVEALDRWDSYRERKHQK